MSVKLLTEHHLEFLSLNEAVQARLSLHALVKMPHCWKSHVAAHMESHDFDTYHIKIMRISNARVGQYKCTD